MVSHWVCHGKAFPAVGRADLAWQGTKAAGKEKPYAPGQVLELVLGIWTPRVQVQVQASPAGIPLPFCVEAERDSLEPNACAQQSVQWCSVERHCGVDSAWLGEKQMSLMLDLTQEGVAAVK